MSKVGQFFRELRDVFARPARSGSIGDPTPGVVPVDVLAREELRSAALRRVIEERDIELAAARKEIADLKRPGKRKRK